MQTIKLTKNTKCTKYLKQKNRTEIIKHLITSKLNYKKNKKGNTSYRKKENKENTNFRLKFFLQRKKTKNI